MAAGVALIALLAEVSRRLRPATGTRRLVLAAATSVQDSGLLPHLLPQLQAARGIEVRVVAVGTGAALRLARDGEADLVIGHHPASEQALVAAGDGICRHYLMHNDYLLVGPSGDPAEIAGARDALEALRRIAQARGPFISRGDDGATHRRERELWREAAIEPEPDSGGWYRDTSAGMGATLRTAAAMGAYTLVDRGTWLGLRARRDLMVLHEGDPSLRNEYGVILVDPARHPHVEAERGQAFIDWLLSDEGRGAIRGFAVDGQVLFHVDR